MFALLVRLTLLTHNHMLFGQVLITAETYNRLFTLHGVIMVFLFIIPSVPAALGNFVLPLMLGAKDVAFPTAEPGQLLSVGAPARCMAVVRMIIGAVDTGWTFYTPVLAPPPTAPSR